MIKNVDNVRSVMISCPIFHTENVVNEFDIIYVDNTSLKFYKDGYPKNDRQGNPNQHSYHVMLMTKISETPRSARRKFIDYQIKIHSDPITWLSEVEALLNLNYYQFEEKPIYWESYQDFMQIIAEKIEELENGYLPNLSDNSQKILYKNYTSFLKLFDYNYLKHPSILFYYSELKKGLDNAKQEILDNLINLSTEDKRAYFEKIKHEFGRIYDLNIVDYSAEISLLIQKYEVSNFNIFSSLLGENRLYEILSLDHEVQDVDNPTEEEREKLNIRFAFYNYYYYDFINQLLEFTKTQEKIYFPSINQEGFHPSLIWGKTDTDMLELITALIESGSINTSSKNITRKEAIRQFELFFNCHIKDSENKLSKATSRKINRTQFLDSLVKTFDEYCDKKDK